MKTISKLFAVGIFTLFLFATITPVFGINTQTKDNNIVFEFYFSKPQINEITIGNLVYDRVTIDDLSNTNNFNDPRLPIKSTKILLPCGKALENLVVTKSDKISLGYNHIAELGQYLMPVNNQHYVINHNSNKENNGVFPGYLYSIIGTYTFRGYSILFVNLHPVQYDPETGEIFYYEYMSLIIETKEFSPLNPIRGLQGDYDVVTNMVDNPSYVNTYPNPVASTADDTYEYVIITGKDFSLSTNRDYSFEDLVQSKIDKGLTAGIFTVEDIITNPDYGVNGVWGDNNPSNPFYESPIIGDIQQFNDEQARIRNFIRYAYTELGTKYVLLGGDADFGDVTQNIVPVRWIYSNETGLPLVKEWFEEDDIPSDVYYACLDGNFNYDCDERWGEDHIGNDEADIDEADLLAEVWVGRACIDSDIEVSNFVKKTLTYEATEDPYLKDILFVGEWLGFPGISEWGGNYKDLLLPYIPGDYNLDTLYDRDLPEFWTGEDMIDILNTDTPHIINHDGHSYYGYNMRMGNSDVESLTNDKYFFVYSHGCMAGGFDNPDGYDCIAESYTVKTQHAAIGGIWNARFGLGSNNTLDSPSGAYDISFFKALFVEDIGEMGRASHYSKEDNIPRINENGMRWCYYETNLFGDPEVSFFDHMESNPPAKPNKPTGLDRGKPGVEYTYRTNTTDPDGDDVYYWFDWGDGTNSGWQGPYPSGQTACESHTWNEKGTYQIKVKAKDIYGTESEWSDPLSVTMPRNRAIANTFFLRFLQQFPLVERLLNLL